MTLLQLTNIGDHMKYLLQNPARSKRVILVDFEKEQSSGWRLSEQSALSTKMQSMGMYWSTARAMKNTADLEHHLQKYYRIVKRIGDDTTERLSTTVQPYEFW